MKTQQILLEHLDLIDSVKGIDSNLDLIDSVKGIDSNFLRYDYDLGRVYFYFSDKYDEKEFIKFHNNIWCENRSEFFLAIFDKTVNICDSKTFLGDAINPLHKTKISSFEYGSNSIDERKYLDLFKKENIDSGKCINDILDSLMNRKRTSVDKSLLDNLRKCKSNIIQLLPNDKTSNEIAEKLIYRCLFIRYLEDRAGKSNLRDILDARNMASFLELLKYYSIFDGDLFKDDNIPQNINVKILDEFKFLFGSEYTHPNGQITFVPYNFKNIPIILISNIYEKFLSRDEVNKKGIVFTPENIVDFILSKIRINPKIMKKIENGNIKVLDPSCGSGVFLVKFLDLIIETIETKTHRKLSLCEKSKILKNCIYGIDINLNALRIASLSLYLKIIDGESSASLLKEFYSDENKFEFPSLSNNSNINLIEANTLFTDKLLENKKFDIIIGNPPWAYKFNNQEKSIIKNKWPNISRYESSQCFLLKISDWIDEDSICCFVLNISTFSNPGANKFRHELLDKYSILSFYNIIKVKEITFGKSSEPASIILFTKNKGVTNKIDFYPISLNYYSKVTGILIEGKNVSITSDKLCENDSLWRIYAYQNQEYLELIEKIDSKKANTISDYASEFIDGDWLYSSEKNPNISEGDWYKKYTNENKLPGYRPLIKGTADFKQFIGKNEIYIDYSIEFNRKRDYKLYEGKKLVISRTWPIKAYLDVKTRIYEGCYYILKINPEKYPVVYLEILEAILNSKLAIFYLGIKHLLRNKGNNPTINQQSYQTFPLPDFENKKELLNNIKNMISMIKSTDTDEEFNQMLKELNSLIFDLYELDYYERFQVEQYIIELPDRREIVTQSTLRDYYEEFYDTFKPFINEELYLNCEAGISKFFGTMMKLSFSNVEQKFKVNPTLEDFILLLEKNQIKYEKLSIFKEEKMKIYDKENLYIIKSNSATDWTKYMAIKDANEELELFFEELNNR